MNLEAGLADSTKNTYVNLACTFLLSHVRSTEFFCQQLSTQHETYSMRGKLHEAMKRLGVITQFGNRFGPLPMVKASQ